jgi:hypothetical protein
MIRRVILLLFLAACYWQAYDMGDALARQKVRSSIESIQLSFFYTDCVMGRKGGEMKLWTGTWQDCFVDLVRDSPQEHADAYYRERYRDQNFIGFIGGEDAQSINIHKHWLQQY